MKKKLLGREHKNGILNISMWEIIDIEEINFGFRILGCGNGRICVTLDELNG